MVLNFECASRQEAEFTRPAMVACGQGSGYCSRSGESILGVYPQGGGFGFFCCGRAVWGGTVRSAGQGLRGCPAVCFDRLSHKLTTLLRVCFSAATTVGWHAETDMTCSCTRCATMWTLGIGQLKLFARGSMARCFSVNAARSSISNPHASPT